MSAISPEQLQQAVQQAVATAAAAQMHQEIGTLRTQRQEAAQPGGYATARKARILRRRHRLEGLERCLQKLCVRLLCVGGLTLGTYGEISRTDAQRDADAVRSIVLDTAVLHAVMLCTGTALTRVVNAGAQEGLEAWRCLVLDHEATSLTRSAGLLQELLNFSFEGETAARMAQFDRDIDRYEKPSDETFLENIRIGVALRMLPDGPLKPHFVLNSGRLTTWMILNTEIDNVRRAQAAADGSVGVWHARARLLPERQVARQTQRQREGQGQPKDSVPTTPCPAARLVIGTKTSGATSPVAGRKRTSPRTRARPKTARTRRLPTTSSSRTRKCWKCNGTEHCSKDCPKTAMTRRWCDQTCNKSQRIRCVCGASWTNRGVKNGGRRQSR